MEYFGELNDENKSHGYGELIDKNRNLSYLGYFENGIKKGQGVIIYLKTNQILLEGIFQNNQLVKGNMYNQGELKYVGNLKNMLKNGFGSFIHVTGDHYIGYFQNGQKQGFGIYFWKKIPLVYYGQWYNDKKHGLGFQCLNNRGFYHGQWKNGNKEGMGIQLWDQRKLQYYDGQWVSNAKQGHGIMIHSNGDIYKGLFYKDQKHGKGLYLWKGSKKSYDGHWKYDKQDGYGKFKFQNFGFYDGFFLKGMKQGKGQQFWGIDQIIYYDGDWIEDNRNGLGFFIHKTKDIYTGSFVKGKKHGFGKYQWFARKLNYTGNWVEDKREGWGTLQYDNLDTYSGIYVNGEQKGYGIYTYYIPIDRSRIIDKYIQKSQVVFKQENVHKQIKIVNNTTVKCTEKGYKLAILDQPLEKSKQFGFKLIKGHFKWLALGLCEIQKQKDLNLELKTFSDDIKAKKLGHGLYLAGNNGWVFNSFSEDQNIKRELPFTYKAGDTIICNYNHQAQKLIVIHEKTKKNYHIKVHIDPVQQLHPCVIFFGEMDEIMYLDDLKIIPELKSVKPLENKGIGISYGIGIKNNSNLGIGVIKKQERNIQIIKKVNPNFNNQHIHHQHNNQHPHHPHNHQHQHNNHPQNNNLTNNNNNHQNQNQNHHHHQNLQQQNQQNQHNNNNFHHQHLGQQQLQNPQYQLQQFLSIEIKNIFKTELNSNILGQNQILAKNCTWQGNFHNNKFEGPGILTNQFGQKLYGEWIQGDLVKIIKMDGDNIQKFGTIPQKSINIFEYVDSNTDPTNYQQIIEEKNSTYCPYCYEDFEEKDDNIIQLRCQGKHIFHKDCITKVFYTNFNCPYCQSV